MKRLVTGFELFAGHRVGFVYLAAFRRADTLALGLVEEAYAFGAFVRSHVVVVVAQCGMRLSVEFPFNSAFINRAIGALCSASAAANAFVDNVNWHKLMWFTVNK